ncbi:nucleotidyltransferase domain-containing protein [Clostridium sp.]|uniref:type VII toxin-antitoxin system MntA family adenylyltransferase antitoxin n=1 Tax=Clostridium sp. TaxID=1506 RepID=UPI003216783A
MFRTRHLEEVNRDEIIKHITEYLINKENIVGVYIFGSFGTDDFNSQSDIDIAILPKGEISYSQCLKLNSELEDTIGIPIDLNDINALPEYIQVQVIMRNYQLFMKDCIEEEKYLDRLNHWIKTEFPFWKKLVGCN